MTIEFHCPHCDKLLKTADDKAGVRANCPGCGEPVLVPAALESSGVYDQSFPSGPSSPATGDRPPIPAAGHPAGEAVDEGPTKACPMCGERIKAAATRCRFCGETFGAQRAEGVPTTIEAGAVLTTTWEIYKTQVGILVASLLIVGGIGLVVNMMTSGIQQVVMLVVAGPGGRPGANNQAVAVLAIVLATGASWIINLAVNTYMQAGLHGLLLRVARGDQPAEISVLFAGGRYFWRFLGATLLFQIMIGVGLLLLIVPGIILALMFWPCLYVIVDRDAGVFEALDRARTVTAENYFAVIVLALASFGVQILGIFPGLCIGLLFTVPFAWLLFAVAYCHMSGQATAGGRSRV
ncbi:MAG: hypothetical protein ACM3U2_16835 [Deltaproteobacteria bacterium]